MIYIIIPDTPEREHRTAELIKSIRKHTKDAQYAITTYTNTDGGWVPAVHNALNGLNDDAMVWLLGSDCVVENNAVKILSDAYNMYFPDSGGILEPYNELHGDTLCQHPFAPVYLIKKYLDKRFIHWYSDNWFTILAKKDGILKYVPEAKIAHNHFINKKAEMDETYKTIFNPETVERDRVLFEKLKNEQNNN